MWRKYPLCRLVHPILYLVWLVGATLQPTIPPTTYKIPQSASVVFTTNLTTTVGGRNYSAGVDNHPVILAKLTPCIKNARAIAGLV
jgi:hypothetical protein